MNKEDLIAFLKGAAVMGLVLYLIHSVFCKEQEYKMEEENGYILGSC